MTVQPAEVWIEWVRAFNNRDWAAWSRLIKAGSQHQFVALDGTAPQRDRDRDALLAHHQALALHGAYIRLYTVAALANTTVSTFRMGEHDGMDLSAIVSCDANGQICGIYTSKA